MTGDMTPADNAESSTSVSVKQKLSSYLRPTASVDWSNEDLPVCQIRHATTGLEANRRYFNEPEWAESYFKHCHRNDRFRSRWQAASGSWDDKIVVDIGCGPGNVFATVGGQPRLLIGVDVSSGALEMARKLNYVPILADAHDLPFISGFADIVVLNAALHHCDHMDHVLAEAARLVAPGGILVSDHDPQLSAWNFKGLAKLAWEIRLMVYPMLKKGFHRSTEEQSVVLASEIHHEPGHGVTREFFQNALEPLGFRVELYPHNHDAGAEVLLGQRGRSDLRFRIAQRLSGLNPNSAEAGLSILCRATRPAGEDAPSRGSSVAR
jgi:SAM-dependent methyltransferase